jgi:hypothetical protein
MVFHAFAKDNFIRVVMLKPRIRSPIGPNKRKGRVSAEKTVCHWIILDNFATFGSATFGFATLYKPFT